MISIWGHLSSSLTSLFGCSAFPWDTKVPQDGYFSIILLRRQGPGGHLIQTRIKLCGTTVSLQAQATKILQVGFPQVLKHSANP